MDKRPNIILLMADQMRGDCLGIAGHPDVKTPFLDALAAEGVRYENAYSACPTCVPARASLYTGMSQEHTGRVGYEDLVPWNYTHTLVFITGRSGATVGMEIAIMQPYIVESQIIAQRVDVHFTDALRIIARLAQFPSQRVGIVPRH